MSTRWRARRPRRGVAATLGAFLLLGACTRGAGGRSTPRGEPEAPATSDGAGRLPDDTSPRPDERAPTGNTDAVVVRDGDAYSFTVPRTTRPCVRFPAASFVAEFCSAPALASPPLLPNRKTRFVAIGGARLGDAGEAAIFTATFNPLRHSTIPNQEIVDVVAAGMKDTAVREHADARVVRDSESTRLFDRGGLPMARIAFDLKFPPGSAPFPEHHVSYWVWAEQGSYCITFNGTRDNAALVDAFAENVSNSIRLAAPATKRFE